MTNERSRFGPNFIKSSSNWKHEPYPNNKVDITKQRGNRQWNLSCKWRHIYVKQSDPRLIFMQ